MNAGLLQIEIHPDRARMGAAAGARASAVLRDTLKRQGHARIIVASAPSQVEVIASLTDSAEIDWSKITVFHMDEYVGLPAGHPETFRAWQERNLLSKVTPAGFHGIRGENLDPDSEAQHYAALLAEAPIDLCIMGIGENGHIAFNDPPVADFEDPLAVKVVELDAACRQQQVNDGCFPDIPSVPTHAITLTCPTLMSARSVICVVPGPRKAAAVRATRFDPITPACPATILRRHPNAVLFLDAESASG